MSAAEQAVCAVHPEALSRGTCSRCGSFSCENCILINPTDRLYCRACGPKVLRARYFKHEFTLQLVGALYIIIGVVLLLVLVTMLVQMGASGVFNSSRIRAENVLWTLGIGIALAPLGTLLVVTGFGVRRLTTRYRRWALVPAFGVLFAAPFGTLIGIVTLSVLLSDAGRYLFTPDYRQIVAAAPRKRFWTWVSWLGALLLLQALRSSLQSYLERG